jgi:hypothetical protein
LPIIRPVLRSVAAAKSLQHNALQLAALIPGILRAVWIQVYLFLSTVLPVLS